MPVTLYVDGPRWRDHLTRTADAHPGLAPVIKGNGYGLGNASLARRADWLGVDTVAVGTYREVADVETRFGGDILVLEPWRPFLDVRLSPRLIHTVGRRDDLDELVARADGAAPRVVLEALTSMRRHGFDDLAEIRAAATRRGIRVEGAAVHLPLGAGHGPEVERLLSPLDQPTWWVSHLNDAELDELRGRYPAVRIRPRIGTALWLGDREALAVKASVLDVHRVSRGDRVGYRQRRIHRDGHLVVVSGGTAHGIALEAPSASATARQRATSVAKGGLEATGRSLSPFTIGGRQRWFVEPPHMQVSFVFVPSGVSPPAVGDEISVDVRLTITHVDHTVIT